MARASWKLCSMSGLQTPSASGPPSPPAPSLPPADISKIEQVIQNLLDNAIKFSNQSSTIEIHTSKNNHKVFVSVKDHGIGIPKDSINKVWDRFYKSDLSRGKDKKGTGLGLSITKEIIESHGENINVISIILFGNS